MSQLNELARLLVPALRWDRAHGFRYLDGLVDDALELGVGGFLVDGGPRDEVAALIGRLHADSGYPILVAAHAERGAGGSFDGLTELPSLAAVASVAVVQPDDSSGPALDVDVVRRAARLTVHELKNLGVNWALAPICDLNVPPGNAAVGNRSAGGDPAVVAAIVSEWIDACQADAVLACAMHFPGLGRSPVAASRGAAHARTPGSLVNRASDLRPFAAAIDAGVASVMVAPVPAPAIGAPEGAMYSAAALGNVLRGELGFDAIATTVALDREPSVAPADEASAAIRALNAGCDVILAPGDLSGTADAMDRAAARREITETRLRDARERLDRWAGWARPGAAHEPSLKDVMWSRQLGDRCVRFINGARPRIGAMLEVVPVGGSATSAAPDAFGAFHDVLRAMHIDVTVSSVPTPHERAPLAVLFDPGPGAVLDARSVDQARAMAESGTDAGRDVVIVALCHPGGAATLVGTAAVLCAWDSSRPMLQAAARALVTSR